MLEGWPREATIQLGRFETPLDWRPRRAVVRGVGVKPSGAK